ncbi:uncharacterized protein LOC106664313 isoform X2 [Cimex lectularius]|uniref:Uncharacterized protein n=1 Tax=Cimex lectularius TaxID=79782 RepID=A0A8I6TF29_CIMLE|nr:uncharacterized protein LOC106664313 isoform X2 [Cimex lectularius]XP_024084962.1 uncharacterized protein LOC106664313 isoform X2 [Cimex lectularius]
MLFNTGYKILHYLQSRPYSKIIVGFTLVAILIAFYLISDVTSFGYSDFIRQTIRDNSLKSSYFSYLNSNKNWTSRPEGYLVWNPSCRIRDTNPFDESIKHFYAKQKLPKCGYLPLLTSLKRVNSSSHVLILHNEHMNKYQKNHKVICCYSLITRTDMPNDTSSTTADNVYNIGKCITFKNNIIFSQEEEFVKVVCSYKNGGSSKEVYVNLHAFVGNITKVGPKLEHWSKPESPKDRLGVMIIGLDSISRLNLLRTMPKTAAYLEANDWFTLKGYNKMDDNTFPNLMAILTGYSVAQIRAECWPSPKTKLDNCPYIWKNFSSQNYITAYGEDEPTIGSFNYHKTGFVKSPTDFYLRPFMLAAEKGTKIKLLAGLNLCLGPVLSVDHVLNYLLDFARQFNNVPTFSLFWMNSVSHNDLNTPTAIDTKMVSFLEDLKSTGILNSTLVIYLSDHGMRFGKIRETYIGHLEERLPYIYFSFPEWYRKENPDKIENLQTNAYRLTSPYDVHMTLVEVLGETKNGSKACQKCQSLLEEIPWKRSCADAGITNHWCTCAEYKTLSTKTSLVKELADYVMKKINQITSKSAEDFLQNGTRCAKLVTKTIHSFRSKVFFHQDDKKEYVILLSAVPGNGIFEATVSHKKKKFKIVDTISRINSYSSQSTCINDSGLKKYCFCEKFK